MRNTIVAAVDIGTSKITVVLGEIEGGIHCNVIGVGTVESRGVRKGEVVDVHEVRDSLRAAFFRAEKSAGVKGDVVFLSQSGFHLQTMAHSGKSSVHGPEGLVSDRDIERAREDAKAKELPEGRLFVHHIAQGFLLDGEPVEQPRGRRGSTVEARYWSIHADESRLRDFVDTVESISLHVEDIIVSSLASAASALTQESKALGALLLDIGAGTTDYVLYHKGVVAATGVVPVGGDHLTNDLSLGLRTGRDYAEKLKIRNASLLPGDHQKSKVWLVGDQVIGDRQVRLEVIRTILHARVEELFEIVKKNLVKLGVANLVSSEVVLTGGTAQLPGIEQVAGKVFGRPARIAEMPNWVSPELRDQRYASVFGLLQFAVEGSSDGASTQTLAQPRGLLGKVARLFR